MASFCTSRGATQPEQSRRAESDRKDRAHPWDKQACNRAAQRQSRAGAYRPANDRAYSFPHAVALGIGGGKVLRLSAARFATQENNGLRRHASGQQSTHGLLGGYSGTEDS